MKKILLGLAAVSTLAFSAIDLATPNNETNTWMTGQTGAITVNGTITSTVPQVQYVVFASTTGIYDGTGETLDLSNFILSKKPVEAVFSDTNPKLYVKRVNAAKNGTDELLDTDVVKFKVQLEASRTAYNQNYWGVNEGITYEATALLADSTLEDILKVVNSQHPTIQINKAYGVLTGAKIEVAYRVGNGIKFFSNTSGVLEIGVEPGPWAIGTSLSDSEVNSINTAFSGGKSITNVRILVTVNA